MRSWIPVGLLFVALLAVCPPDAQADEAAPAAAPQAPRLDVAAFKALATTGFAGALDGSAGLAVARALSCQEPENDLEKRPLKRARLLCGAGMEWQAEQIQRDLLRRIGNDQELRCEGLVCSHDAEGEFDEAGRYEFEARDGALFLRSVAYVEGGPVSEEFMAEGRAWTQKELAALRKLTCAAQSPAVNHGLYRVCNTARDENPGLPLRAEPSWKAGVAALRSGAEMPDGTLVDDLGARRGQWWGVQVLEPAASGWVKSVSTEKGKVALPVLCPLGPTPPAPATPPAAPAVPAE